MVENSGLIAGSCIISFPIATVVNFGDAFRQCTSLQTVDQHHHITAGSIQRRFKESAKRMRKRLRKPLKAEANAQVLLRDIVGWNQWEVYRKTNRILVKPNKHFWIIGNVFGSYNKRSPFSGKPDVVRIDNPKKLYATSFCAVQSYSSEATPYTDQVILFILNLIDDETLFLKTVNRMGEKKFNKMKECATWNIMGSPQDFGSVMESFKTAVIKKIRKIL